MFLFDWVSKPKLTPIYIYVNCQDKRFIISIYLVFFLLMPKNYRAPGYLIYFYSKNMCFIYILGFWVVAN